MYLEVQKGFSSMGLNPKLGPFNHRILWISAVTAIGVLSLFIYLMCEADSAEEYTESVCVITICAGILLTIACTILITKRLFSFIKAHDEYLNESKPRILLKQL